METCLAISRALDAYFKNPSFQPGERRSALLTLRADIWFVRNHHDASCAVLLDILRECESFISMEFDSITKGYKEP